MLRLGLLALIGTGFPVYAGATDLTCSDITFTPEAFTTYESINKACLEMVDRDGATYAMLSARVVAQTRTGTHVRFLFPGGQRGPAYNARLPADFETMLSGQAVRLEDLAIRQDINIYVSERYWSAPEPASEPASAEPPASTPGERSEGEQGG